MLAADNVPELVPTSHIFCTGVRLRRSPITSVMVRT
jgi:hypothetical protein